MTKETAPTPARAAKRPKMELFIEKGEMAVAKLRAAFNELGELSERYRGHYTAEQKEKLFSYIEEKLQVPAEQRFNAALAGKATATADGFSLNPVPADTPAT